MNKVLRIYKTDSSHILPEYATEDSACFDISVQLGGKAFISGYDSQNEKIVREVVDNKFIINPDERMLVPSGLIFVLEPGTVLKIYARGSTGIKLGLKLSNAVGIIDADYFHETFIPLMNVSKLPVVLTHGDRIAQGEIHRYDRMRFEEIAVPPVQTTSRTGGFGSTGRTQVVGMKEPAYSLSF